MKKTYISILFILIVFYLFTIDYTIPQASFSLCSGDIDGDGDNDIVVGHYSEYGILTFLYNNGNGEFTFIDTIHFFGGGKVYEIVNLDENPNPDLVTHYVNGFEGTSHFAVFYNGDIHNPIVYDSGISGHGMSWHDSGDLDNDGDLDLVFSFDATLWCAFYNLGNQEFSEPVFHEHGVHRIKCSDLDGDNKADVVTQGAETYIFYSTGDGFESDLLCLDVVNGTMVLEDMNNDGYCDIVLSQLFQPRNYFRIYENLGNREYLLHEQNIQGSYAEALSADINGDQLIDIAYVISPPSFSVYFNQGNFILGENVNIYTGDLGEYDQKGCFNDFDGNGTQDIAIARHIIDEPNILSVLFNDGDGNFSAEPVSVENHALQITNYELRNYPNPFNPITTISYRLPVNVANLVLEILNIKGRKIKTLKVILSEVEGTVIWDGTDNYQNQVSSGVYLYRLKSNESILMSNKMLLLK